MQALRKTRAAAGLELVDVPEPQPASPDEVLVRVIATGICGSDLHVDDWTPSYAFVSKAIYWIPDVDIRPLPDPIPLVQGETSFVIDVTERADGEIYFTTGNAIYHLAIPAPRLRAIRPGG